jgi:hypothetical protein
MTRLAAVPDGRAAADSDRASSLTDAPAAGPVDEVTRARLRRLLAGWLGEFGTLDLHLDLLDARSAWYAEAALGAWTKNQPDSFFGVVRHVVRTQFPGPLPDPDLEGWLAAGVPDDSLLSTRWEELNVLRYQPSYRVEARPRAAARAPSVARVDEIVRSWPEEHFDGFTLAYARLEQVLDRRGIVLPPVAR